MVQWVCCQEKGCKFFLWSDPGICERAKMENKQLQHEIMDMKHCRHYEIIDKFNEFQN